MCQKFSVLVEKIDKDRTRHVVKHHISIGFFETSWQLVSRSLVDYRLMGTECSKSAVSGLIIRHVVAAVAGALALLALPPFSILVAVPIAWSALFVVVLGRGVGAAFALGWIFGITQFTFGLWWITESFMVEPEKFGPLAVPAIIGLSAFLSLFPAMAMTLFARLRLEGPAAAVGFAACWAGTEWLRGHILTGFPWNLAAYALADHAELHQTAALVGSYGLSFLTVLAGVLPAVVLRSSGREQIVAVVAFASLIGAVWTFGATRLAAPEPRLSGTQIRIVQGNVAQREKWDPSKRAQIFARYLHLSARPGEPDIILWPESAFPGFLDEDTEAQRRLVAMLPKGALLLTGVPDRVRKGAQTFYYNTVQAYSDKHGPQISYAKHHLVPFGEYVPFRSWLPYERMVGGLGDFSPGPGPRTLELAGLPRVSVAICYEIIFPGHVVNGAVRPDWIFNATNDAWFGASIGPKQHLASARMRAVEEGLPVIRAANTGISAVIDAKGRVLQRLEMRETGIIDAALPGPLSRTPYARAGDWMVPPLIALALLMTIAASRMRGGWRHD